MSDRLLDLEDADALSAERAKWMAQSEKDRRAAERDRERLVKERDAAREDHNVLVSRAEAAEANSAVIQDILRDLVTDGRRTRNGCPGCGAVQGEHTDDCRVGHAVDGAFHPGAALLEELRRLRKLEAAMKEYIRVYNVEHDETEDGEECPEDDTCACAHVKAINEGLGHG